MVHDIKEIMSHLRARRQAGGTEIGWIRRTRIDGDGWIAPEVPLAEEREAYLLRLLRGGTLLREVEVTAPLWTYTDAARAADGPGAVTVSVAQQSAAFGPGPFRSLTLA